MKRMPFPAEAIKQKLRRVDFTPWVFAIVIAFGMGYMAYQFDAEADREDAAALSSQEFVAQVICGKGKVVVWINDTQHDCIKETK